MRQTSIGFKSGGLTLEGVLGFPQGLSEELSGGFSGVVVCHPHPLFGGNMDNSLVMALCRALDEEGFATLRFNFRGVGNSEGPFTKGEKECEDVRAALDVLRRWPGVDRRRLGLVGYSFGASMLLAGLPAYKAAKALAVISPPLASFEHQKIGRDKRPKLFIVGGRDRLVPHRSLKERIDSLPAPAELQMVEGADHSWRGYEAEAARETTRFLVDTLQR